MLRLARHKLARSAECDLGLQEKIKLQMVDRLLQGAVLTICEEQSSLVVTRRFQMNPKVFVSHASEDKERFVTGFATRLRREAGVDAWVDQWEIYPGDSLVTKIFDEGLKDAQAVIVVVSDNSVNKPWVREELDASVVKKVGGLTKLIPVVIDDCEVPESLKATVWQRIEDLNRYDSVFARIVASIYDHREKPVLGPPPKYTQRAIDSLPGLTLVDTLVLKSSCEKAIERLDYLVRTSDVWERVEEEGVPRVEFVDSLEILGGRGYIKPFSETIGAIGDGPSGYTILVHGFEEYAKAFVDDYAGIKESVAFFIVNNVAGTEAGSLTSNTVSEALSLPEMVVNHILKLLERQGLVQILESAEGRIWVMGVSVELRRMLNG